MLNELLKFVPSQEIWTALSIFLIFYILKVQEKRDLKQEEREKNYQVLLNNLTEKFNILQDVKNDLKEIKEIFSK